MSNLNTLPPEILLRIAHTIHISLPNLALASKHLHHVLNPLLYRFVHYDDNRRGAWLGGMEFPDWPCDFHQCSSCIDDPRQDSRIVQLDLFVRTLVNSPQMRSTISAASFQWDAENANTEKAVLKAIGLLSPSVRFVHVRPVKMLGRHLSSLISPTITSLEIRSEDFGFDYKNGNIDGKQFYSLFCLPGLTSLSVQDVRSWSGFKGDAFECIDKVSTSNITCLNFPNSVPADTGLAEVLSWPKALRSYRHEVNPWDDKEWEPFTRGVSGAAFVDALETQRETLEEFFLLTLENNFMGVAWEALIDLSSFTSLRRLGLLRDYLTFSKVDARSTQKENSPISAGLPPALEELQLEISNESFFKCYFEGEWRPNWLDIEPGEIIEWLCDIAKNKRSKYPRLRKVVVWRSEMGACTPQWINMERYCGYNQIKTAFEEAKIKISWLDCGENELFSAN
ncbi:hypothetical protein BGZ60DRAFT_569121 [Tricladium varicosporioides]|nr:hypothetical protein BGZ60DRAFT_569121 [Hymenoscyphus varicosporioides]